MKINKNAENSRINCMNRINREGRFFIEDIGDIGLGCESNVKAICTSCDSKVCISRRRAYNYSCPVCGDFESSNEHLINKILKDNNIKFYREYNIKSFGNTQLLDFYIPKFNLAIEHQGNQHYNKNNGLYNIDVVKRDKSKFVSCLLKGIGLTYTYENEGLIFDQLYKIFTDYGIHLKKYIGTDYPPAKEQWEFIQKNPNKSIAWYLSELGYGRKTFDRYLKMCGFIGLSESMVYLRWKRIPDDEFLDYLSYNGLRKTATHYNKTVKTVTTHLCDLGYKNLYDLQMERETTIEAYDKKYILDLIVSKGSLKGASEKLGFPKYILEHYLPKLGYKNYADVCKNYHYML